MTIADFIKPKDSLIIVSPSDTVSTAIGKMHSSHDAAFVFEGDRYLGVVNPYYALVKQNSLKGDSLVANALYHPPKIDETMNLEKIVSLMISARIHYLPFFQKGEFIGAVGARRILTESGKNAVFTGSVAEYLDTKDKALVSVYETDMVSKIIHKFDDEDVSKLVVITKDLKLTGIMSYYDLFPHLIVPTKKMSKIDRASKDTDAFAGLMVKTVAKSLTQTVGLDMLLVNCLVDMVRLEIGSVVVINDEGYPIGIVTVRDLLQKLIANEIDSRKENRIELSTNGLSEISSQILFDYSEKLERRIEKIQNLKRAMMLVKEERNGSLFKVTLSLIPTSGKSVTYIEEGKNLLDVLTKIKHHKVPWA